MKYRYGTTMPSRKYELDQLDYEIIRALNTNARISAADIARETETNERTIRKRIEWLIEHKVFRLTAILDPDAFGYITAADFFLEVTPSQQEGLVKALLLMPEVTYLAFGQDTNEISLQARFRNNDEMREFLRSKLPDLAGVKVAGYALVPRILRNIDEWVPRKDDFTIKKMRNKNNKRDV
jgi:Lrp/AsnC family transcriptional regulator for asnA, asnC and gidA